MSLERAVEPTKHTKHTKRKMLGDMDGCRGLGAQDLVSSPLGRSEGVGCCAGTSAKNDKQSISCETVVEESCRARWKDVQSPEVIVHIPRGEFVVPEPTVSVILRMLAWPSKNR